MSNGEKLTTMIRIMREGERERKREKGGGGGGESETEKEWEAPAEYKCAFLSTGLPDPTDPETTPSSTAH